MKHLRCLIGALWLTGCTTLSEPFTAKNGYVIDSRHIAYSQNERIRHVVLHYTVFDDRESLEALTTGPASAHYLVPTQPTLHRHQRVALQLVPDEKRAWHAGASQWAARTHLNDTSIGIEIVNPGYIDGPTGRLWFPYTEAQLELVRHLTADLIQRYAIAPQDVIGHSDIAPARKSDPGPLFPWQQLADLGIGAWPDPATVKKHLAGRPGCAPASIDILQKTLAAYGYKTPQTGTLDEETRHVVRAFQMHFRPTGFSGIPDAETEAIALALVEKYRP